MEGRQVDLTPRHLDRLRIHDVVEDRLAGVELAAVAVPGRRRVCRILCLAHLVRLPGAAFRPAAAAA